MEKTGKVETVTVVNAKNGDGLRCLIELRGGNCDKPFTGFSFTGGMVEQARALNPGDQVTLIGDKGQDGYTYLYKGLSIISNHSIV